MLDKGIFLVLFILLYSFSAKSSSFSSNEDNSLAPIRDLEALKKAVKPIMRQPFKLAVLFGSCCLTKMRIISFQKLRPSFENTNHLFDWMVPLNYTALGEAIGNEFQDVFGRDHLTVRIGTWDSSATVLYNDKYKFQFNHAFEGHWEVSHYGGSNVLTEELFHKYYYLIEDKFKHLTNNSRNAIINTKNTLYVVYASQSHSEPNGQRSEDFVSMMHSIKKKRNNNFLLLILVTDVLSKINQYDFDSLIEDNLIFHQIKYAPNKDWNSWETREQWNEILEIFFE